MATYVPYPDAELVTIAAMEMLAESFPGLEVDTFLPTGFEPPFIQVNRIGGGEDTAGVTDYPVMRLAFYMPTRNESWQLAAAGEAVLKQYEHRNIGVPGVGPVLLDSLGIVIGGQMLPDLDPDDRRVVKDFVLGFRRQHHLVG